MVLPDTFVLGADLRHATRGVPRHPGQRGSTRFKRFETAQGQLVGCDITHCEHGRKLIMGSDEHKAVPQGLLMPSAPRLLSAQLHGVEQTLIISNSFFAVRCANSALLLPC